jgi:flagellar biosynthetic protein FlhB
MAEESSQERTEEATPHRKEEAIKRGDVVHSREVVTAATVLAAVVSLPVMQPLFVSTMERCMRVFLNFHQISATDIPTFERVMFQMVWVSLPLLLPVFALILAAGIVANIAQVGWVVSAKKLEPKPERLDPVKGLQRVAGRRAAAEAVRTVIKFLIIGGVTVKVFRANFDEIAGMQRVAPVEIIPLIGWFLWQITWRVALFMIAFAVLDYAYQRWDWGRRLRMSRQELKEELKEREGNPLIKQRIRSIQMEQARRRMMAEVPKATAVVTNPTHCAVALRYRPGEDRAPVVVAKGVDYLAMKIRDVAREHSVPVVEDKPIAWALYRSVKLNREVPAHLYRAVAEILAYVFRLGGWERIDTVQRRLRRSPSRGHV